MISKRAFLQSAVGTGLTLFCSGRLTPAQAAVSYPTHAVKWVVPYAAGAATDVLSRLICQRLSDKLGQPFLVENKPGAGSNFGTQFVITFAPDGYTLLLDCLASLAMTSNRAKLLPATQAY